MKKHLNLAEACKELGRSRATVYEYLRLELIRTHTDAAGLRYFAYDEVARLAENLPTRGRPSSFVKAQV